MVHERTSDLLRIIGEANTDLSGFKCRVTANVRRSVTPIAPFSHWQRRLADANWPSDQGGSGDMKRILLVEDDRDVRFVLEHVLLAAGYAVDSTQTAFTARLHLGTRLYDLVLADGKLEDGSGIAIADLGETQGAKALVITGYARLFSTEELERHPYLMKPVRPAEVIRAVEQLIGVSAIQDSI
jgi:CheY-like chemotaxis protein